MTTEEQQQRNDEREAARQERLRGLLNSIAHIKTAAQHFTIQAERDATEAAQRSQG